MNNSYFDNPANDANTFLVLSPHLDDAVLSCGPLINAWKRAGAEVVVGTIFTGDSTMQSSAVQQDASRYEGDVMTLRRAEEAQAQARLGYAAMEAGLPELLFRQLPDGSARCASLDELYGLLTDSDREIVATVRHTLAKWAQILPSAVICAPLAIGDHLDHHVVREAALQEIEAERLRWYRDVPYALDADRHHMRGRQPMGMRFDDEDLDQWLAAVGCYPSQLANMFGDVPWEPRFRSWAHSGQLDLYRYC